MKTLDKQGLIDFFHTTESMIKTNFPLFCRNQLKQGYLITKRGKGETAEYDIEKVPPQNLDKSNFSSRQVEKSNPVAEDEIWVTTYCSNFHEVSNYGRIRKKENQAILKGSINKEGYQIISLFNQNYRVHRIVLQSFNPIENFEYYTVDHINGQRADNKLSNLRWATNEENISLMMMQRADLNKELTRIIQQVGYDETLELLKKLPTSAGR